MKKYKILVLGGTNMELSMNMYKIPVAGEKISDDGGVAYVPGGYGLSAAISLARLGADAMLVTKLGRDLHGQQLYSYLREAGVNTSLVKVDNRAQTSLTVNLKTGEGVATVAYPGATETLMRENVREGFLAMPDAVLLSLDLPVELVIYTIGEARAHGIPVFIDGAPADGGYPLESLPEFEVFTPNEQETEAFVGQLPIGADASLRAAVSLFRRVKCKYLVIKQGDRGAFIYDGKRYFMIPPIAVGKPLDTQGAGDAFNAGIVLRYLAGQMDIKSAVQYGSVVAAIAVTRRGAYTSVPTDEEVVRFLEKYTS